MKENKRAAINTVSSIITQITSILVGMIIPRLYLQKFGSEINGIVNSIQQFINYFTVVEAGLANASVTALYAPMAEKNNSKISSIVAATRKSYNQVGFVFSGLVVVFSVIYPFFIHTDTLSMVQIMLLACVLGFGGALDFFTLSRYRVLLTASRKYYVIANATTAATIINFVMVWISIRLCNSIIIVRMIGLTLYIFRSAILNIYVRMYCKGIDFSAKPDMKALNKRNAAMGLQILEIIKQGVPIALLTFFGKDMKIVSVWAVYNMVVSHIIAFMNSFTNGYTASLGLLYAKGDNGELNKLFKVFEFVVLFCASLIYSCVAVLYIPFVSVYTANVTDINYVNHITAVLFTAYGTSFALRLPVSAFIEAAGMYRETRTATLIQTVAEVVLCSVFMYKWGINGILIGLVITQMYRNIDLIIVMRRKILKNSPMLSFRKCGVVCICILAAYAISVVYNVNKSSFGGFFVSAIGAGILCTAAVIFIWYVFYRNDVKTMIKGLINRINKREKRI